MVPLTLASTFFQPAPVEPTPATEAGSRSRRTAESARPTEASSRSLIRTASPALRGHEAMPPPISPPPSKASLCTAAPCRAVHAGVLLQRGGGEEQLASRGLTSVTSSSPKARASARKPGLQPSLLSLAHHVQGPEGAGRWPPVCFSTRFAGSGEDDPAAEGVSLQRGPGDGLARGLR